MRSNLEKVNMIRKQNIIKVTNKVNEQNVYILASSVQRSCDTQNALSEPNVKPSKCALRSPSHLIRNNQQNEFGTDNDFDDSSPMTTNRETLNGIVYCFSTSFDH
jgi:hypothetical protein